MLKKKKYGPQLFLQIEELSKIPLESLVIQVDGIPLHEFYPELQKWQSPYRVEIGFPKPKTPFMEVSARFSSEKNKLNILLKDFENEQIHEQILEPLLPGYDMPYGVRFSLRALESDEFDISDEGDDWSNFNGNQDVMDESSSENEYTEFQGGVAESVDNEIAAVDFDDDGSWSWEDRPHDTEGLNWNAEKEIEREYKDGSEYDMGYRDGSSPQWKTGDSASVKGKSDYLKTRSTEKKNTTIEVFYATDRKKVIKKGKLTYTGVRGTIAYGVADINIPQRKKKGEVPRPTWWKLQFSENPDKHMMILRIAELAEFDFFSRLAHRIGTSNTEDAFVFIHGYNVSFEDSLLRAAQMAYDLHFQGAPVVYSWPSKAATVGYLSDEDNVKHTVKNFIRFLRSVKALNNAKKIHLIAHSMGNRALTDALLALQQEDFFNSFLFNQVILAAPDIDAQIFAEDIAPRLIGVSHRLTLYTSSKDLALTTSRKLRGGEILRAGLSGNQILVCKGLDTVDASNVDMDLMGHGYFASTAPLINDMYLLTRHNHSPEERNLNRVTAEDAVYWEFAG